LKKNLKLEPLELLDLAKCKTVSDVVDGMSRCAFGARMLGEVAATLTSWCQNGMRPHLIYDGRSDTPLGKLIEEMQRQTFNLTIFTPELYAEYSRESTRLAEEPALVVGSFSERHAEALFNRAPGMTIYVNQYDLCAPGQVKDGYFPNAVFADPNFIMPILALVLDERLNDNSHTVSELIEKLALMPGVGMQVKQGAETLVAMMNKKGIRRFLTLSGAMTIAQLSLVICEMIDRGMVHSITSTGALMAHGLVPGLGLKHFKYNPKDNDEELAARGLNRVTDVLEPETNFDHIDEIMAKVLDKFSGRKAISPSMLHWALGEYLAREYPGERAILRSAHDKQVPVFVPAFTDSELGNDVYCTNKLRQLDGRRRVVMDMEKDTARLVELMTSAKSAGIWTFGGGVPRNWTQNVSPLIEIYNGRIKGHDKKLPMRKFGYGCRCCPDRPYFGHLSGCTYQEGMSWRKFHFDMRRAEIQADATQVEPFLVKYIMDLQDSGQLS